MFKIRIYSQSIDRDIPTNVAIIRDIPSLADAYIICKSVSQTMRKDPDIIQVCSDIINMTTHELIF